MKILILGGFLGSGKTSVLLQLAEYLVSLEKEYHSEVKVAIVFNTNAQSLECRIAGLFDAL